MTEAAYPCEDCGELVMVGGEHRTPDAPLWCDQCLLKDKPTSPVRVVGKEPPPVIKLVTAAEREAELEAKFVEEVRDAAHAEALEQVKTTMGLLGERRCRGLVIAAIFEEPNGMTAMLTSVPSSIEGIYTSALVGAVHHASWRLHQEMDTVEELPIPGQEEDPS